MRALITLVAMIGLLAAGTSKAGEFASDMETIDTASQHNDVATLEQLQVDLTAITPDYRHAYVAYCLSIARQVSGQNDVAEADLDEAIDILQVLVEEDPDSAETWALLSNSYGLKVGYSPFLGPFIGPRASNALDEAMRLEPENPRVALVKGISLYHTPKMFGGDKAASIDWFSRAIERYAVDPGEDIRWGHSEAYIWRALAHYHFEETGLALADLDSALAIAPDEVWAQRLREQMSADDEVTDSVGS